MLFYSELNSELFSLLSKLNRLSLINSRLSNCDVLCSSSVPCVCSSLVKEKKELLKKATR